MTVLQKLRLPPRHRLMWWVPGSLPFAALVLDGADAAHPAEVWIATAGAAAYYAIGWGMEARFARRRCRSGELLVIEGGARDATLAEQVQQNTGDIAELFATMERACEAAGIPVRKEGPRLVDDGTLPGA